ncbi:UNVERIFIED_ORG: hypothetical protein BDU10_1216 [Burkholderia sp. CF145]
MASRDWAARESQNPAGQRCPRARITSPPESPRHRAALNPFHSGGTVEATHLRCHTPSSFSYVCTGNAVSFLPVQSTLNGEPARGGTMASWRSHARCGARQAAPHGLRSSRAAFAPVRGAISWKALHRAFRADQRPGRWRPEAGSRSSCGCMTARLALPSIKPGFGQPGRCAMAMCFVGAFATVRHPTDGRLARLKVEENVSYRR